MKKSFILGTTIAVVATYVVSRKVRNEALINCFRYQVIDGNCTKTGGKNEMVDKDIYEEKPTQSKMLKVKNNNSLISISFKWDISFGSRKKLT